MERGEAPPSAEKAGSDLLRKYVTARGTKSWDFDESESSMNMSKYYDAVADGSTVVSSSICLDIA